MTNNEPDYNDNLAFEPEMTWKDLVEWAENFGKEKGLRTRKGGTSIDIDTLSIWQSGFVYSIDGVCLNIKRTPRQMQTIIKALYE